jgi:outer membrane protein assembly factor BamB
MRTVFFLVFSAALGAQDWLTFSGDPQRTGWARGDEVLNKSNAGQLKLAWTAKVDNAPKHLNSLTAPLVARQIPAPGGFRDVVVVAGASDNVYVFDADSGKLYWKKAIPVDGKAKNAYGWLCPGALNATPVIDKRNRVVHVLASDGKLHTFNFINGEETATPVQLVPPFSKPWSLNLVNGVLYSPVSQGCDGAKSAVYAVNLADPARPVTKFMATTSGGAGIWGRAGVAVTSKGNIVAETGDGAWDPAAGKYADTFLMLAPKTLELVDYYTPQNRAWITKKDLDMGNVTPVAFPFGDRELIAGAGKEGVIYLLDAAKPGGDDHRTPLFRSPLYTNESVDFAGKGFWGSLSTWQDAQGVRWLYAPAYGPPHSGVKFPKSYGPAESGSVMAFKVVDKGGKPELEPAWMSRNLGVPEPVVVSNGGVVIALSNGEDVEQVDGGGKLLTSEERIQRKRSNAVLYALDAHTGQELWSSQDAMKSFTHFSGLGYSDGRVYVTTFDGTIYCFALPPQ